MIRIIITFILSFFTFIATIFAQDIKGDWHGQLDVQGQKLRVNFHVKNENNTYITTMDSPDQKAFDIPTDETVVNNDSIKITLKSMMIVYKGVLKNNIIEGIFSQGGMKFPLNLSHKKIEKETPKKKPQEPTEPFPYKSEEVSFINTKADNIKLVGTLTLPNNRKKPAAAILISGSGPQDRNEEILGHKPFLVLSDYLTRNGIAVLRIDDRGVGESEGTQKGATSADFATDIQAAFDYLMTRKDVDCKKIGLIGHSEGGFIAPIVAAKNKDIAFIILLASPGVDGAEVLITQAEKSMNLIGLTSENIAYNTKLSNEVYDLVKSIINIDDLKKEITNHLKKARETAPLSIATELTDVNIENQAKTITSPWMRYFIKTNPKQFLKKVSCPVLALNGEKDFQVIPNLNLNGIKKALKNNKDVTIKELENLNHLFQTCETGSFNEYAKIEETFAPKALEIITTWINKRF